MHNTRHLLFASQKPAEQVAKKLNLETQDQLLLNSGCQGHRNENLPNNGRPTGKHWKKA
ncbi:hypothetical protein [Methylomonas sp. Kb3]|uniref:hypothetical protein n=1 Tax=Methylomonas sp. Kb3 TaxID=1611544 RepID=UPI0013FE1EF8|nr:hypothetical protein [Methylomonas sp. Kb3]